MKNMHGIIFSYEKRNDLRELVDIRSAASMLSHTEAVHGTDSPDALGAPIVL